MHVWTTKPLGAWGLGQPCWKDLQFQALRYDILKLLSIKPPAGIWDLLLGLIEDPILFRACSDAHLLLLRPLITI